MKARCFNSKLPAYKNYGGRGITMAPEWRDDFAAFLRDMGPRPPGTSIDRYPDNDGPYAPGNCRWATRSEQRQNTRPPMMGILEWGFRMTMRQFAELYGINVACLYSRVRRGLSPNEAVRLPIVGVK